MGHCQIFSYFFSSPFLAAHSPSVNNPTKKKKGTDHPLLTYPPEKASLSPPSPTFPFSFRLSSLLPLSPSPTPFSNAQKGGEAAEADTG